MHLIHSSFSSSVAGDILYTVCLPENGSTFLETFFKMPWRQGTVVIALASGTEDHGFEFELFYAQRYCLKL
jgi:hypothetical protein